MPKEAPVQVNERALEQDRAGILIVDDRHDKRLALATVLDDLGQDLVAVESGEDALRAVLERDFAVILLDVNMPGMDGLETAALIRRRRRSAHTPIIFITADYNDEPHTAQGYSLGAVDYIGSPVVPEILRAKVRVFVDLWLLARDAERRADEHLALAEEKAARAAAERTTRRLAFLAQASTALGGSLDISAITQELARLAVPAIADGTLVWLPASGEVAPCGEASWRDDADRVVFTTIDRVPDEALAVTMRRVLDGGPGESWSLDGSYGRQLSGPVAFLAGGEASSLIVVPLIAHGRRLGVLALGSTGRIFDADAFSVARDLASRASLALDNASLYGKIHEADRRKDEFIATLAHELRNPLAPIRNAVHLLQGDVDPAHTIWARDVIDRQVRQLVRLVDDLLDLSRITRDKIELRIATIDAAAVVAAAVETSRPAIDERAQTLTVTLPDTPRWLAGDSARVAQVLSNILNNAAKYTEKGGTIALGVAADGGDIVFSVRDTGRGISREHLSSIFDAFVQVDHAIDRAQGGLGIGLTLVRRLVEMQGGSVTAHSDGRDRGSEFVVRLPAAAAPEAHDEGRASAVDTPATNGHPLSVLVVDDNADVAESTAIVLRAAGCIVHLAYDGHSALESVSRVAPAAVLLDIGLPGMSGFEVAQRIRAMPGHHDTLLVAVSGYGQEIHRRRAKEAGFDHHFVKPIDPTALTELLRLQQAAS